MREKLEKGVPPAFALGEMAPFSRGMPRSSPGVDGAEVDAPIAARVSPFGRRRGGAAPGRAGAAVGRKEREGVVGADEGADGTEEDEREAICRYKSQLGTRPTRA